MFSQIRTSKEGKAIVTKLTNTLQLGAENTIARIALGFSLSKNKKLDLNSLKDSSGKTYSYGVLFGEYDEIYLALITKIYSIHKSHPDFPKYVKLHLDDGLKHLKDKDLKNITQLFNE